jgi:hypothetical protein
MIYGGQATIANPEILPRTSKPPVVCVYYMSGSSQNNLTTAVDHAHAYNFSTAELGTHYLPKLP